MKYFRIFIPAIFCLFFINSSMAQNCSSLDKGNIVSSARGGKTIEFIPVDGGHNHTGPDVREDGDRVIFWTHGLGGRGEEGATSTTLAAWKRAGDWSRNEYELQSVHPTYSSSQITLASAAHNLETQFVSKDFVSEAAGVEDYRNNYIIAHSQGGVVSRQLEMMHDLENPTLNYPNGRRFGGIVTFGSPHQGAEVINNKDRFPEFTGEACAALGAAPIVELIETLFFLNIFLDGADIASTLTGQACGFLENTVIPLVFKDFDLPITEEYKKGAPQIDILNNHAIATSATTTPKMAFYGEEDEPLVWKILASLAVQSPNDFDFGTAPDDGLIGIVNDTYNTYDGKYEQYKLQENYWHGRINIDCNIPFWGWIACPIVINNWNSARQIRIAYQNALEFLDNSNDYWKSIIGAKFFEQRTSYTCTCSIPVGEPNTPTPGNNNAPISLPGSSDGFYLEIHNLPCSQVPVRPDVTCSERERVISVAKYKPSDGIVLSESAARLPSASHLPIKMQGSNHQQMRNDYNLSQELPRLFGEQYVSFF
jgi:hypothetical protein